jgi:RsiW-degrading membrane proteinase PrsW (M82 family)
MTKAPLALLPVLGFLGVLVLMDSFKLVSLRAVLRTILVGGLAALLAARLNESLLDAFGLPLAAFTRYAAPVVEESLKGLYLVYLIGRKRVGFLVDAAIYGFALGAGFAVTENLEYLVALPRAPFFLWVVRGLGTAMLHGGTTAIAAVLSKGLADRHPERRFSIFLPGLVAAAAIHSAYNHFVLPPLAATGVLLVVLPIVLVVVFERSETATREWLGVGFDTDVEVLRLIVSSAGSQTRVGSYLRSLRTRLPGLVVADMSCLLRLQLELSIRAKGLLMAREAGVAMAVGKDVKAAFQELHYLERSIGRTGLLALKPIVARSSRDLWELYLLEQASGDRAPGT